VSGKRRQYTPEFREQAARPRDGSGQAPFHGWVISVIEALSALNLPHPQWRCRLSLLDNSIVG
jgi:hypothetical protein